MLAVRLFPVGISVLFLFPIASLCAGAATTVTTPHYHYRYEPNRHQTRKSHHVYNREGHWQMQDGDEGYGHVEADGDGHLVPIITDPTPNQAIRDSEYIHEEQHIADAPQDIAVGAPAGALLAADPGTRAQSEVSAYTAQENWINSTISQGTSSGYSSQELAGLQNYLNTVVIAGINFWKPRAGN